MSDSAGLRTPTEQTLGVDLVTHEVYRCCEAYASMKHFDSAIDEKSIDPPAADARDAALVATLTYARSLIEFFLDENRRDDDIQLSNFPGDWEVSEPQLAKRLGGDRGVINKHLAHLTWTRLAPADEWTFDDLPATIEALASSWLMSIPTDTGLSVANGRAYLTWARSALERVSAL
jgi:hypothetical protein